MTALRHSEAYLRLALRHLSKINTVYLHSTISSRVQMRAEIKRWGPLILKNYSAFEDKYELGT